MRKIIFFFCSTIASLGCSTAGFAQNITKTDSARSEVSVTKHDVTVEGKLIHYKATAGTLILKNEKRDSIALLGYTAYVKEGEPDARKRPVTFAYNGGPGSSSMWLHMGVLGPRIVQTNDPGITPAAPYKTVDNEHSILDVTDLIMVDPVGTGLSHPIGKATGKDFWGVDQDIKSISQFIKQYITDNDRWNSPKFIMGESYGTFRSAGVADYLFENMGMELNGVVLISSILDFNTINSDLGFELFLPTYAAVSWYHHKAPNAPASLETFLKEVRTFTAGEYASALQKGDLLSDAEKDQVAAKLFSFTGISKAYWINANLRVPEPAFTQELLRDEHLTAGRLDGRYKGINTDLHSEFSDDDPQSTQISPPYIASFLNYYYTELKVNRNLDYKINCYSAEGFKWDFSRAKSAGDPFTSNTADDLSRLMSRNPALKILVLNGYYDLATPFFATEYTFNHMGLEKKLKENITMKYFEAGHMMYVNPPSLISFKKYVADFMLANAAGH